MSRFCESYTRLGRQMALVSGFLVLVISLFSSFEVVMRYFLNSPTSWTFELSRYLMLVLIWFGATGTLQNDSHISVDFVVERIPDKIGRMVTVFGYAIALVYCMVVMCQTWIFYLKAVSNNWVTLGNFPIPSSWLYLVIFVGSVFLCLAFIQKIYETISQRQTEKIKIEV
jgi:TRAP-type C4-dicarboxylate transport system permease small subunit